MLIISETIVDKKQVVLLYENEKPRQEIIKEYDLSPSTFDRWVKQYANSGSFKEKDNRSKEETELIQLRKKIQQLKMANDILIQAALIMSWCVDVIRNNIQKYSVSAMCSRLKFLEIRIIIKWRSEKIMMKSLS